MNEACGSFQKSSTQTIRRLISAGVTIVDPATCYVKEGVTIGPNSVILPNTVIMGDTTIGEGCVIGPNTVIWDSIIGDRNEILCSYLTGVTIRCGVRIGPFSYLRPGTVVEDKVKIGDFVEIKNAHIGAETKIAHLTYVGDADVGKACNFGCGTVVVNYDGKQKHRSKIGDRAFIGCNANLVSPVSVGAHGYIAAGSTVTENVPDGALAIARAKQENKRGWVHRKGYFKQ